MGVAESLALVLLLLVLDPLVVASKVVVAVVGRLLIGALSGDGLTVKLGFLTIERPLALPAGGKSFRSSVAAEAEPRSPGWPGMRVGVGIEEPSGDPNESGFGVPIEATLEFRVDALLGDAMEDALRTGMPEAVGLTIFLAVAC